MSPSQPALRDLLTILYRPRETMRAILEKRDRWSAQVVMLAFLCASVNDADVRNVEDFLPGLHPLTIAFFGVLLMLLFAACWVLVVYLLSFLVTFAGHLLGGSGARPDVSAAISWGLVPLIWSVIFRIPIAIYQSKLDIGPRIAGREGLMDFVSRGGCAFVVATFAMQIVAFALWLLITSNTVAEAQRFSTAKGLANVAITIAAPVLIIGAAVFAFHIT